MIKTSSTSFLAIFASGAMAFLGLTPSVMAGDSMNCDSLAARMASMARQDPAGAAGMVGASLGGNCACVLPVADAVFAALGAGSRQIPAVVYELSRACPSQAGDIAAAAVAVSPDQEAAILDAASRGAGMDDAGGDFLGLKPVDTSGVYLIPPSAPSAASVDVGVTEVIVPQIRTRTVTRSGGTRVIVVSPANVGG